jgi:hypothetical protein
VSSRCKGREFTHVSHRSENYLDALEVNTKFFIQGLMIVLEDAGNHALEELNPNPIPSARCNSNSKPLGDIAEVFIPCP